VWWCDLIGDCVMSEDAKIRVWMDSHLMDVFQYSSPVLSQYCLALAQDAKSPSDLIEALRAQGAPDNSETIKFAAGLYKRAKRLSAVSRVDSTISRPSEAYRAFTKETYGFIPSDDEINPLTSLKKKSKKSSDSSVVKGKRKRPGAWDEEEQVEINYEGKQDEEEVEVPKIVSAEEARNQDMEERDKIAKLLREKDLEKTKSLGVGGKTFSVRPELAEIATDESAIDQAMPEIREKSRQEYLRKRLEQQIRLLEAEIRDDERIFFNKDLGIKLTKRETARLEEKRNQLKIAKQMLMEMDVDRLDDVTRGYQMLESIEGTAPIARNVDKTLESFEEDERKKRQREKKQKQMNLEQEVRSAITDQEVWERSQIDKALAQFGGGGGDKKTTGKVYDFVIDDQVEFIKESMLNEILEEEDSMDVEVDAAKERASAIDKVRRSLPIFKHKQQLIEAVGQHNVLIVVGETGSGKTTQLPQYLHEAGYTRDGMKIGCTQPRRVAAMSVAARVSQEMQTKLGLEVGYSIRFEDCTSDRTIIKYMTDGMLLREFLGEPDLKSYSVMIVDEAHERSLHTDVLLGLLKDVSRFRDDLRIIIASATVNAKKFSDFFDGAPVYKVPGRRFPVDIYYTKAPEANYLDACVVTVLQIHFTQDEGDVLVFLTGQEEIEAAAEILEQRMVGIGSRAADLQAKIFEPTPPGSRKVVLATNIAETSLTIDGIRFVIDPGFCKQNSYNPRTGLESLIVTPISKASAEQRAGRAGRTAPGKCFRLYTAHAYMNELEDEQIPELQRTNLGSVVLMLKSLGINDLIHFDFLDPPPAEMLIRALEQLYALAALNDLGQLTKLGRMMAEFPVDPMQSKMLIQSEKYGVSEEILTITAMLGVHASLFYRPKEKQVHADTAHQNFAVIQGDHLTLLNVYNQWRETDFSVEWCHENFVQIRSLKRARDIREQLEGLMERVEVNLVSNQNDHVSIRKAIASGYFYHTAKLDKGDLYKTIKYNHSVLMHPSSCLFEERPRWVIYNELVLTSKKFMRCVMEILPEWLVEIAPHYYQSKEVEDHSKRKLPKRVG